MTHYICPICDLELKGGRYCPTCKKWIREPIVYHGESMPNEHGDNCFVPSMKSSKEPVANVSRDYTRQAPRRTPAPSHRPAAPTYNRQSPSRRNQPANTGKGVGLFIFIIWIIIVIFMGSFGS